MAEQSITPDPEGRLRRSIEAGNRLDFDAALAVFSKEAVWDRSPVGQEVFEGRHAIRNFYEDWTAVFEDYLLVLEEFRDLGSGVTFAGLSQRGRPRAGGGSVEEPYAAVVTWRDGLIMRVTVYPDVDDARAAAERLAEVQEQAPAGHRRPPGRGRGTAGGTSEPAGRGLGRGRREPVSQASKPSTGAAAASVVATGAGSVEPAG